MGGSGWCSIVIDDINAPQSEFDLFFGSNFWIYLTLIIVPAIAISLIAQIKLKVGREKGERERERGGGRWQELIKQTISS